MLSTFNFDPDFKIFYKKLHAIKGSLTSLVIPITKCIRIKSGYHFITALLSNLTKLKSLTFLGYSNNQYRTNTNFLKCVGKGMTNFVKNGGNLDHLEYNNLLISGSINLIQQRLYKPFACLLKLKSLTISKTNMLLFKGGKRLNQFIV